MELESNNQSNNLKQLPNDPSYIAHETQYMNQWNDTDNLLYHRMIKKNANNSSFSFMDGCPFVSGSLHIGHISIASIKSTLFNYKIMDGYSCENKHGFDCHGLPALSKTASDNNLTIEQFKALPLEQSNALCEKMVFKYKDLWKPVIQRIGRLTDFENDYMTRDPNFMESCWFIFKQIYDQRNVYKGEKVMPYSYGIQSPLSNSEASQNYKEKSTKSIYVAFELNSEENTHIVVWTTTPFTLPSNLALCVNANMTYVKFRTNNDKTYIVTKSCIKNVFDKTTKIEIISEMKGSDLVGLTYKPMFPFTLETDKANNISREYKIVADNYVTEGQIGSGVVHLAPAMGEDDFRVCFANNLIDNKTISLYCPIDECGKFTDNITPYKGRLVFDCEDDIRADLKKSGHLLKIQLYTHSYPYCYRTDKPLIYKTNPSYYIKTTAYKDRMIELNKSVNWIPSEVGTGRFHNWLKDAKDWAISRSTSYATPIPIWKADDGSEICVGSIDELEILTGVRVSNLHPEFVNDLVIIKDNKTYKRIADTFDCWFESGSVPMAQLHYPFNPESKILEEQEYLSDFISEGSDQVRGWYFSLMILSTAIFNKAPYRNVMCTGIIFDKNGDKISKRLGNYVDPMESLNTYGADVIRTYFINSPVMNAEPLKLDETNIMFLKRRFTPYINGVKFWIEHTMNFMRRNKLDSLDLSPNNNPIEITNLMDKWILLRTNKLVDNVKSFMDEYKFSLAIQSLLDFIDELTNWYIKFNRDRIKGVCSEQDRRESIYVLYNVLMTYCRLWAPFTPFLSEHIYQHLRFCSSVFASIDSVLLTDYPKVSTINKAEDNKTLTMFKDLQRVCTLVRSLRDKTTTHTMSVVSLKQCTIYHDDVTYLEMLKSSIHLVQGELNCKRFVFEHLMSNITIKVNPNRKMLGQFFRGESSKIIKLLESLSETSLMGLYDGIIQIKYNSDMFDEIIDQRFYTLIKVPVSRAELTFGRQDTESNNVLCQIDNDLMVSIDHTYDESIHNDYQYKRLHSAVQKSRKEMKLHTWDAVTVILDNRYATEHMRITLQDNLSNAEVLIAVIESEPLNGVHETEHHKMHSQIFDIEPMPGTTLDIDQNPSPKYLTVRYLKQANDK
jgi:isoleucyl-tRNA synthetase